MGTRGESPRPLRIAEVIGQLTTGGAEHQLAELVERLDRQRFLPIVYCLSGVCGPVDERLRAKGIDVRSIGSSGPGRARRLAAGLRADGIDLIHSWLFLANSYAFAARLCGARFPLVSSARNCKSQGWAHHLANVAAFGASARIVVNSARVRDYVTRHYRADPRRITIVPNGVDTERFRPPAAPVPGAPVVVTAGRLVAQKNPLLFVRAAALLREAIPQARFVMIGDGPLRASIASAARAAGLGEVLELVGERSDPERYYQGATLFWLTSNWEGLPNVVLEALASGLPAIVTDVGGAREIVSDGSEGFVVPAGDASAIVTTSVALLADPALRSGFAARARRRALDFSLERMVRATERVYAEVLGGGQP